MNLPKNYFWIPGYEDRYAMLYNAQGNCLTDVVYSFQYPGCKGKAVSLDQKGESGNYSLSRNGIKTIVHRSMLKQWIYDSPEFKGKAAEMAKSATVAATSAKPSATWIIGSMQVRMTGDEESLQVVPWPKQHDTEAAAYAEAERLATASPGRTFIVLKAVRKVVVGGVSVTDL